MSYANFGIGPWQVIPAACLSLASSELRLDLGPATIIRNTCSPRRARLRATDIGIVEPIAGFVVVVETKLSEA